MNGDYLKNIYNKVMENKITVNTIHPFPSTFEPFLFDRYQRRRNEMEERFIQACSAAKKLGAKYYVFHGERNTKEKVDAKWTARVMDNLCKIANEFNVKVAWENVWWCRGNDPEYIKEVLNYMKEDIFFTLDVKQAIRSRRRIEEYLDVYKDRVANVHISDSNSYSDCILPGFGDFDFSILFKKVLKANKDCQFIIEVYRDSFKDIRDIQRSYEFLSTVEV